MSFADSRAIIYEDAKLLGYFGKYTDSHPESWARKIIWAYQKLKEDGMLFYLTDI